MNLDEHDCRTRLGDADHGVLATLHPERGVDAVPVVYALVESRVIVPLDTVKAKRLDRSGRLENVARDDRCVLLVEHYRDDWSQLWWVRMHARAVTITPSPAALDALARRYPPYRQAGVIPQALELTPTAWYGWRA